MVEDPVADENEHSTVECESTFILRVTQLDGLGAYGNRCWGLRDECLIQPLPGASSHLQLNAILDGCDSLRNGGFLCRTDATEGHPASVETGGFGLALKMASPACPVLQVR